MTEPTKILSRVILLTVFGLTGAAFLVGGVVQIGDSKDRAFKRYAGGGLFLTTGFFMQFTTFALLWLSVEE